MGLLKGIYGLAVCGLLLVVIPSQRTVAMIAASEVSGRVVTSDIGSQGMALIQKWITAQSAKLDKGE